jgi:3-hydroxy acid dehydrogenase / malonic semialdehyde reductase
MLRKTILVTGATSGFGEAFATIFAQHGHRLIITGRRAERLESLANTLRLAHAADVLPLAFDVSRRIACFDAISQLPAHWQNIDILINNAGLAAGRDPFDAADLADWETMIDTNLKGTMYMTKAVLPLMKAQNRGHIVNMGSIAGKEVYANGNGYCASKFAVVALSKSMRIDLLPYNIKVSCINPGAAETEFSLVRFKGDAYKADAIYHGYTPLQAADVAHIVHYVTSLPDHVCINDLDVTPTAQASSHYLHKT